MTTEQKREQSVGRWSVQSKLCGRDQTIRKLAYVALVALGIAIAAVCIGVSFAAVSFFAVPGIEAVLIGVFGGGLGLVGAATLSWLNPMGVGYMYKDYFHDWTDYDNPVVANEISGKVAEWNTLQKLRAATSRNQYQRGEYTLSNLERYGFISQEDRQQLEFFIRENQTIQSQLDQYKDFAPSAKARHQQTIDSLESRLEELEKSYKSFHHTLCEEGLPFPSLG